MPRPRARLDLARVADAFAADGLHGVSTAALARGAGVAKPTLFAHGGSKAALLLACVEHEVERLVERVHRAEATAAGQEVAARATALAGALLAHAAARPDGFRLLQRTADHRSSPVAEAVGATLARVPDRLQAALGEAAPDGAGAALWGAAGGVVAAGAAGPDTAAGLGRAIAALCDAPEPERREPVTVFGVY